MALSKEVEMDLEVEYGEESLAQGKYMSAADGELRNWFSSSEEERAIACEELGTIATKLGPGGP